MDPHCLSQSLQKSLMLAIICNRRLKQTHFRCTLCGALRVKYFERVRKIRNTNHILYSTFSVHDAFISVYLEAYGLLTHHLFQDRISLIAGQKYCGAFCNTFDLH